MEGELACGAHDCACLDCVAAVLYHVGVGNEEAASRGVSA